eukprot:181425-Rhodomonas_salina.2
MQESSHACAHVHTRVRMQDLYTRERKGAARVMKDKGGKGGKGEKGERKSEGEKGGGASADLLSLLLSHRGHEHHASLLAKTALCDQQAELGLTKTKAGSKQSNQSKATCASGSNPIGNLLERV